MVKAFYVELEARGGCGVGGSSVVRFVLVKLAEALEKMRNLVDLRILYCATDRSEWRISQAIRLVCNRWQW